MFVVVADITVTVFKFFIIKTVRLARTTRNGIGRLCLGKKTETAAERGEDSVLDTRIDALCPDISLS